MFHFMGQKSDKHTGFVLLVFPIMIKNILFFLTLNLG